MREGVNADRHDRVTAAIGRDKILPVVTIPDASAAVPLATALRQGGLSCVEITFRTDTAETALRALRGMPGLYAGAGTVLSAGQAERAAAAGAQFAVAPGLDPEVVSACEELGLPVFPGVITPTEIHAALRRGLHILKYFPAEAAGGESALSALGGPFPTVRFIPTGGIGPANLTRYVANRSVLAVGGSWLTPVRLITARDFGTIQARVEAAVALIRQVTDSGVDRGPAQREAV
jgi:2-dehydro-3-deoxyphosphogluconate aldolase / (4S)-4-hydroxy-2-oxoglutarate aldolase